MRARGSGVAWAAVAAVILGLGVPSMVSAGGGAPCEDPFIFSGAAVNAVVLPFEYADLDSSYLSETGENLATLVQLEVLLSMAKYNGVGAVVLHATQRQGCHPRRVLDILRDQMQFGHGLILIWGRIFEQQEQVYVQTYAQFLRKGRDESLTFVLPNSDDPQYLFKSSLPTTTLSFTPRRLSHADLERIDAEYRQATMVREAPDARAAGVPLEQPRNRSFAYSVPEIREGWMYIEMRDGVQEGWLQIRDGGDWALRRKLPELALIDAIAGYLRLRVGLSPNVIAAPSSTVANAKRAIAAYREFSGSGRGEMPSAMASILEGLMTLSTASTPAHVDQALEAFSAATRQAPSDSALRNLTALAEVFKYGHLSDDPEVVRAAVGNMLSAVSLDPTNVEALANLESCYRYLEQRRRGSVPAYSEEELTRRLEQVRRVRQASGTSGR